MFNPSSALSAPSLEQKKVEYSFAEKGKDDVAIIELVGKYPDNFTHKLYEKALAKDLADPNSRTVLAKVGEKIVGCITYFPDRHELDWMATEPTEPIFSRGKVARELFNKVFESLPNGTEFFWHVNTEDAIFEEENPTGKPILFGPNFEPARRIYRQFEKDGLHGIKHEKIPFKFNSEKWKQQQIAKGSDVGNHAYKFYGKIAR